MRLFHCTSKANARKIMAEGFRCGYSGLVGGGIYFAESVHHASRKAHEHGVVLVCDVDLGRVMTVGFNGDPNLRISRLKAVGYDSVRIPRNGTEYCVYEPHRVRVVGRRNDPAAEARTGRNIPCYLKCPDCDGTGYYDGGCDQYECSNCDGTGDGTGRNIQCPDCDGTGYCIGDEGCHQYECSNCNGTAHKSACVVGGDPREVSASASASDFSELLRQNREMMDLMRQQQETIQLLVAQLIPRGGGGGSGGKSK
jgi:hypothetical protein